MGKSRLREIAVSRDPSPYVIDVQAPALGPSPHTRHLEGRSHIRVPSVLLTVARITLAPSGTYRCVLYSVVLNENLGKERRIW